MYPLRGEKPGLHPNLTYVRGDRGCRNPIPEDVAETRGFALGVPKAKKSKRLATRDTLHRSRPNLRQREPDGRIVPTPPDVWDKGASTKRCARRKKKITNIHIHEYIFTGYSQVPVPFLCFFFFYFLMCLFFFLVCTFVSRSP